MDSSQTSEMPFPLLCPCPLSPPPPLNPLSLLVDFNGKYEVPSPKDHWHPTTTRFPKTGRSWRSAHAKRWGRCSRLPITIR